MDFWKRVEEELKFQGKTKKELAALTQIKEQTLHKAFERGSSPSAEAALKIAKVLHVSIEFLLTGDDRQNNSIEFRLQPEIKELITKMNSFSAKQKKVIFDIADVINERKN